MVITPSAQHTAPWGARVLLGASLLGGSGILMGAFAAHALRAYLAPAQLSLIETAVRYQLLHAVALLSLLGIGFLPQAALKRVSQLWVSGVLLFSGSLYALALSGVPALGAITPLGGLALIAGWVYLAWQAVRAKT